MKAKFGAGQCRRSAPPNPKVLNLLIARGILIFYLPPANTVGSKCRPRAVLLAVVVLPYLLQWLGGKDFELAMASG